MESYALEARAETKSNIVGDPVSTGLWSLDWIYWKVSRDFGGALAAEYQFAFY